MISKLPIHFMTEMRGWILAEEGIGEKSWIHVNLRFGC